MSASNSKNGSLYSRVSTAFDHMQRREQLLLMVAVPITILTVLFLLLIEPDINKTNKLTARIDSLENQLALAQEGNKELQSLALQDPNASVKNQIDSLQRRLDVIEREFEGELSQLVSPQAMPVLLEQLFSRADGLTLSTMKSIAPEKIILSSSTTAQQNGASTAIKAQPIFRHGIEITFEGSFFNTRDFLAEAQKLGWKLYWQDLSYEVSEHPNAVTQLTLFTLSTSEAFIGVN